MSAERTILVVPCYNEADRLPVDRFADFSKSHPEVGFLLVNDGSHDDTLPVLRKLASDHPEAFDVIDLQPNRGKAAAVRVGMQEAFERQPDFAGYWDADLATPLEELPRFVEAFAQLPDCEIIFGARVQLLGRSIVRRPVRHYLGRLFATMVSLTLGLRVYDTQCGAKLFRVTPETEALFREPFLTNWIFDVELVSRLIRDRRNTGLPGAEAIIYELPLLRWEDVAGSKVKATDFLRAFLDLWRIHRRNLGRAAAR